MNFSRAVRWWEARHTKARIVRGVQAVTVGMLILAISFLARCAAGIPQSGDEAPSFELDGADGQPMTLAQLRQANEAVVLVFYRGLF